MEVILPFKCCCTWSICAWARDVLVGGVAPTIGSAIGCQPKILVLAISKMYINNDVKL